ncbi:ABC transporter ATP-binding protein [Tropicimonas aquimaris]|uniref:ABC transporter ATP-binding protein n=1 Tax=Tropicimonas aquimaris TaxID=914152 RepID=A0ABW3IQ82_9RHOB
MQNAFPVPQDGMLAKFRRLLPYLWEERGRLSLIILLSAVASALTVLAPWPLKILVDVALGDTDLDGWRAAFVDPEHGRTRLVVACGVATALLMVLTTLVGNALSWLWASSGHRMLYAFASDLFDRIQRLSLLFHFRQSSGDLLSRITGDSWAVYSMASQLLVTPVRQILTIIGVGATAIMLSPLLTALIFVLAPLMVWSVRRFGQPIRERAQGQRQTEAALASFAQQTLSNMPLVQVFGLSQRNTRAIRALGDRLVTASQQLVIANDGYTLVNNLALATGASLVLFVGAQQVLAGDLSVGSLLIFMAYVESLREALASLLSGYGQLRTIEASADRVLEVVDARNDVPDRPNAPPLRLSHPQGADITFDGVSFTYEPERPALHEVSLEIAAGETLALVGPTGAGKSTLAALLPRFFDPQSGEVRIDGQRLPDVALASLRAQVSIVLQEPFLLPLSIAENIAFGRPDATENEIRAAAQAANADAFIEALPDGYDSVIGERGMTLSGGQRQRISIARALAKDTPILIFDEPTSAVDPETEAQILEAMSRLLEGRTTVIIAHRLSTIERADRVAFLEDGRIVELGTHEQLQRLGGRMARFQSLQGMALHGGDDG